MSEKKAVLAYSGGLDTSCILRWLQEDGYEVVAFIADVGQREDFEANAERARSIGAQKVVVADLKREFVTDYIFPAVAGNAVYENRYLLGTSLARPIIAKAHVDLALAEGATAVSHGATGKGNDQVRFELAFAALAPSLEVIAPWKERRFLDRFQGRTDLLQYAEDQGIPVDVTASKPYSMDENLMHKSYEAGMLEDPALAPPDDMFDLTRDPRDAPDTPEELEIEFAAARPIRVRNLGTGEEKTDALELYVFLDEIARRHGVGRIDMVENRFVGIKSRGVYETPAGTVLHRALRDLEGITMDREVLALRDSLSPRFTQLIYNGFWFSPEMDVIRAAFDKAEENNDGVVRLRLYKGGVQSLGRESSRSLYDQDLSSMDIEGGYDQEDARGFIRINGLRLQAHHKRLKG